MLQGYKVSGVTYDVNHVGTQSFGHTGHNGWRQADAGALSRDNPFSIATQTTKNSGENHKTIKPLKQSFNVTFTGVSVEICTPNRLFPSNT